MILTTPEFGIDGAGLGLFGGHNWQAGNLVLGVEADVAAMDASGVFEQSACRLSDCIVELHTLSTFRGRAGYAHEAGLYYVTVGVASVSGSSELEGISLSDLDRTSTVFGIGGEWMLGDGWSVRAEALTVQDFGREGDLVGGTLFVTVDDFSQFRLGVARRF